MHLLTKRSINIQLILQYRNKWIIQSAINSTIVEFIWWRILLIILCLYQTIHLLRQNVLVIHRVP